MSIRPRLLLMLLLPMTLVVGAYAVVRVRHVARLLADEEQRHVAVTARPARIAVESALRTRRPPEVQRLLAALVQDQEQVQRIRVLVERRRSRPELVASPEEPEPSASLAALRQGVRTRQEETHVEGGASARCLLYRLPISATRRIDRISTIIRALPNTVRLRKPEIQWVTAQPAVTGVHPLPERLGRRRGIVLEAQVPPDLPEMAADPAQLQQLLLNLLMNAIEATPEGGARRRGSPGHHQGAGRGDGARARHLP